MRFAKIVAAVLVASAGSPAEADGGFIPMSTWQLPGTPSEDRWLEVHEVEGNGANMLFHVSVLSREKGRPVWSFKHVLPHMAITEAALRRGVTGPAPTQRMSYPEQYDEGYSQWRKLRAQSNASICETSVLECAHLSP
jgi:hypothetical protein